MNYIISLDDMYLIRKLKLADFHSMLHMSKCAVAGCSYTDPVISMDLLRTVLQPSFNEDILAVFRKYMKVRECIAFLLLTGSDDGSV